MIAMEGIRASVKRTRSQTSTSHVEEVKDSDDEPVPDPQQSQEELLHQILAERQWMCQHFDSFIQYQFTWQQTMMAVRWPESGERTLLHFLPFLFFPQDLGPHAP
ncbi:hypothetical protein ACH5RR_040984 [Cinchona calisaya]|uniref:Uncharacterized protein n=1 Tax=Cinchona calisaya TaxID=153742 RepID=A0ABD2XSQ3_9GENT